MIKRDWGDGMWKRDLDTSHNYVLFSPYPICYNIWSTGDLKIILIIDILSTCMHEHLHRMYRDSLSNEAHHFSHVSYLYLLFPYFLWRNKQYVYSRRCWTQYKDYIFSRFWQLLRSGKMEKTLVKHFLMLYIFQRLIFEDSIMFC